jgi:hypothetical protein
VASAGSARLYWRDLTIEKALSDKRPLASRCNGWTAGSRLEIPEDF